MVVLMEQYPQCSTVDLRPFVTPLGTFCPFPEEKNESGRRLVYCYLHASEALFAKE